jgi:hypothetical protein
MYLFGFEPKWLYLLCSLDANRGKNHRDCSPVDYRFAYLWNLTLSLPWELDGSPKAGTICLWLILAYPSDDHKGKYQKSWSSASFGYFVARDSKSCKKLFTQLTRQVHREGWRACTACVFPADTSCQTID